MTRVLHLNGEMGWGGNEQQLVDSILSFSDGQVENLVYCMPNSALSLCLIKLNCAQLVYAQLPNFKKNSAHLKEVIKSLDPDILHIHTSSALTLFYFTYFWGSLKPKVVYSKKGMGSSMSFLSKIKYNFKRIDVIICVSDFVRDAMKSEVIFKKNYSKLVVVPDGVSEQRISMEKNSVPLDKNSKALQVLSIANHTEAKDLEVLIDALYYLVSELKFKEFFLHQLGSFSKLTPALEQKIAQYDLSKCVKLYGFVDHASTALKQVDILVMTSKKEGGPSTIIEAMSQKVPVVTTNVGVVPQAITSGFNGIVVPVQDYKAIANGIIQLSQDSELRSLYAKRSYKIYLNDFTATKTAQKTLNVYREILHKA